MHFVAVSHDSASNCKSECNIKRINKDWQESWVEVYARMVNRNVKEKEEREGEKRNSMVVCSRKLKENKKVKKVTHNGI